MLVARPFVRIRRDGEEAKNRNDREADNADRQNHFDKGKALVTRAWLIKTIHFRTAFPVSGSIVSSERKAWFFRTGVGEEAAVGTKPS